MKRLLTLLISLIPFISTGQLEQLWEISPYGQTSFYQYGYETYFYQSDHRVSNVVWSWQSQLNTFYYDSLGRYTFLEHKRYPSIDVWEFDWSSIGFTAKYDGASTICNEVEYIDSGNVIQMTSIDTCNGNQHGYLRRIYVSYLNNGVMDSISFSTPYYDRSIKYTVTFENNIFREISYVSRLRDDTVGWGEIVEYLDGKPIIEHRNGWPNRLIGRFELTGTITYNYDNNGDMSKITGVFDGAECKFVYDYSWPDSSEIKYKSNVVLPNRALPWREYQEWPLTYFIYKHMFTNNSGWTWLMDDYLNYLDFIEYNNAKLPHRINVNKVSNNEYIGVLEFAYREFTLTPYGMDELSQNFLIFPNPTSDVVNIEGEFDYVEVFAMTGQMLSTSKNKVIDLSSFPNGVYVIAVYADDKVYRTKVIKH
jgi:hypothetical protein